MTAADQLSDEIRDASKSLRRCECGSAVVMAYEPGCTFIRCHGCQKTVVALPDWCPKELASRWNNRVRGSKRNG